jgi:hypothetical protein
MGHGTGGQQDFNKHKYERVREWAEDYIKTHVTNAPRGFNELLRLVKDQFGRCGVKTLKTAIDESESLQTWESKTKEWAENKKRANAQPNSLDTIMQPAPDSTGHLHALKDNKTLPPEEEADNNERIKKLCSMSLEKLQQKVKGTFFNLIRWTDDVEGGRGRDPNKEWEKLRKDPNFDASNKESLARFCIALEGQIPDILSRDPTAKDDPIKRRYLPKSNL